MLRKYQKAEEYTPLSEQELDAIGAELRKIGKQSMADLTDKERAQVTDALDDPAHSPS